MVIEDKGGHPMGNLLGKVSIIVTIILCVFSIGVAYAQQLKAAPGDIVYNAYGSPGTVTFSHEIHVKEHKLQCSDCHPEIFGMTRGEAKMLQCTTCHNGKRAFSNRDQMLCTNCHK
jgi:c(7)-type cytochrome triheme protein